MYMTRVILIEGNLLATVQFVHQLDHAAGFSAGNRIKDGLGLPARADQGFLAHTGEML
jgi:hypothetical protein